MCSDSSLWVNAWKTEPFDEKQSYEYGESDVWTGRAH